MRTFIAIDLPGSIRHELGRKQDALRAALSFERSRDGAEIQWVRPEAIHLTLKFLGEISNHELERLIERLRPLGSFEAFPVEVRGLGFFPDAQRPRVLWAGVTASPQLSALAGQVEAAASGSGFEIRPFRPHLTLARFRSPRAQSILEAIAMREEDVSMGSFVVSEFAVYESKLSKTAAPEYRKLAVVPEQRRLAGDSGETALADPDLK